MAKGIIRKIDFEGRIVLPKELRDKFNFQVDDEIDIYCSQTQIILERPVETCIFCKAPADKIYKGKGVCIECQKQIYDQMY